MKDWWKAVLGLGIFSGLVVILKNWGSQSQKLNQVRENERIFDNGRKIEAEVNCEMQKLDNTDATKRFNSLR